MTDDDRKRIDEQSEINAALERASRRFDEYAIAAVEACRAASAGLDEYRRHLATLEVQP